MTKRKVMESIINDVKNILGGYWMEDGKQIFTEGHLAIRLAEENIDTANFKDRIPYNGISRQLEEAKNIEYVQELQSLKELRQIARDRKAAGEEKKPYQVAAGKHWYCNIKLLIRILEVITVKGSAAYIHIPDNGRMPAYIECGGNDAILLPVLVRTKEEEEARAAEEAKREEEHKKRLAQEAAEEEALMNRRSAVLEEAEKAIINNGKVENKQLEKMDTTIILALMYKYEIDVPIRTKGWINNSLVSIDYEGNDNFSYKYYNRTSTVFSDYMQELKQKIKAAYGILTTEEEKKKQNEEYIKEVEKSIKPIQFEQTKGFRISDQAKQFWQGCKAGNTISLSQEAYILLGSKINKALRCNIYSNIENSIKAKIVENQDHFKSVSRASGNIWIKAEAVKCENNVIIRYTKSYYNKDDVYTAYETVNLTAGYGIYDSYSGRKLELAFNSEEDAEKAVNILIGYKKSINEAYDYTTCETPAEEAEELPF